MNGGLYDVRYNAFKIPKLKSTILPFGGLNIMFMKDFLQFPPISTHHYFQLTSNQLLHSQIQHQKKNQM